MADPKRREEAGEWLRYAAEDLDAAEILLRPAVPKPKQALFHAQQAVEKALKAFLLWSGRPYPLTHSLPVLLDQCAVLDSGLRPDIQPALWLTQFSVRFRYPGEPEEPAVEDAEKGIEDARQAVAAISKRLSKTE